MIWVLLVLAYGIIKGLRDVLKKKALEKSTVIEVLFMYTFISFLLVVPEGVHAFELDGMILIPVAFKSLAIFVAWLCSFEAIRYLPVSLYGVLDLSRVLFATLIGVAVLNEHMGPGQIAGTVLVLAGLLLLKLDRRQKDEKEKKIRTKYIIFALISCILNSVSGVMDKILMSDGRINDGQLQFWYMLFLVTYYLVYILVRRLKIRPATLKNVWIWILAVCFVVADRCLFIANGDPASRVTVMTLIKQSSCLITIAGGRIVFKEKRTGYKLLCASVVLAGIFISVIL